MSPSEYLETHNLYINNGLDYMFSVEIRENAAADCRFSSEICENALLITDPTSKGEPWVQQAPS